MKTVYQFEVQAICDMPDFALVYADSWREALELLGVWRENFKYAPYNVLAVDYVQRNSFVKVLIINGKVLNLQSNNSERTITW